MSTLKTDAIVAATGTNTDLSLDGKGSGVPDLATGFKVGGTAGVPVNNLRTGTDGELITWDASGDPATVAVGTATHVLTSNGAGAAPTFQAAGGGATAFIATITASNAASVDFDSGLSSTYKNYLVVGTDIRPATNGSWLWARVSSDGGSTWDNGASDYQWQISGYASNAARPNYDFADSEIELGPTAAWTGLGNGSDSSSLLQFWIGNPSSTSNNKTCVWQTGGVGFSTGDEPYFMHGTGYRDASAAINSVQFLMSSGNIYGTFNLYGWVDS